MGRAVVYDLARAGQPVRIVESDRAAALRIAQRYGRGCPVARADAADPDALARALRGAGVVVNCAPYRLNLAVMDAALRARCHYVDLGGLFHTTRRQLRRHREFRRAGLLAVLGMGSAPGLTNVLARAAADPLRSVRSIRVYNGGADFTRYASPLPLAFSPATVLDEFTLSPMVFDRGRFRAVPPLSGEEAFRFELGTQRVHFSLHSEVATLPLTYRRRGIRDCAFKIAYDPEIVRRLRFLIDLGLTDPRPGARGVAPRDVLLDALRRLPPAPDFVNDRDSLAVVVDGADDRGPVSVRYDLTARPRRDPPLSAVACDTGFPPAIVARLILAGRITERGVLPPEGCVPAGELFAALARRGMRPRRRRRRPRQAALTRQRSRPVARARGRRRARRARRR
jgi:saccharopine dehydrogenase (NAD+, L-lysine-forming)